MASSSVSFIAKVEVIRLHQQYAGTHTASGWTPPTSAAAFVDVQQTLFRWHDGNLQTFDGQRPAANQKYSAATIFNQWQSKAVLSVLCDARAESVIDKGGWRPLGFEAAPAAPTLSQVGTKFKNEKLRVPGGQPWVGQLLPTCYHHQGNQTGGPAITGLVGELPILIALAALSTSEAKIEEVLRESIRGHKWIPHKHTQEGPQDPKEKGIVVTVYCDPKNSLGSTKARLKKLEEGELGGFYRT